MVLPSLTRPHCHLPIRHCGWLADHSANRVWACIMQAIGVSCWSANSKFFCWQVFGSSARQTTNNKAIITLPFKGQVRWANLIAQILGRSPLEGFFDFCGSAHSMRAPVLSDRLDTGHEQSHHFFRIWLMGTRNIANR